MDPTNDFPEMEGDGLKGQLFEISDWDEINDCYINLFCILEIDPETISGANVNGTTAR